MFTQEKNPGNLEGIIGNVFQAVFAREVYKTVEEKVVHFFLLQFNFKDRINSESLAVLPY